MRKSTWIAGAAAVLLFAATSHGQTNANGGFEKLKSLAGNWAGTGQEEEKSATSWRLVSGGTALEETLEGVGHEQMVTIYTPDGDRLAMTHYCTAGNQPRMETKAVTGSEKEYTFSFTGGTNMSSPSAGHMDHLVIRIEDADHFSELWTWKENGSEKVHAFHFTRVK